MKSTNDDFDATLHRHMGRTQGPSPAQLDASRERIRERLADALPSLAVDAPDRRPIRTGYLWRFGFAIAAAAVVFALLVNAVWNTAAIATIAEGSFYVGPERQLRQSGRAIDAGEAVRSNGGQGGIVELSDGSRIEMKSQSELSLERADDGLRIRLQAGGIIVSAAKQPTGHLFVRTKDMTVAVVGTIFMVNADDGGSRVAVIEGKVRVQQGATDKNLLPGDQVATSPAMIPAPISEEIAWSRNAEQLRALLQQSAVVAPSTQSGAVPVEVRPAFELVTIRPAAPSSVGARGAGPLAPGSPVGPSCAGSDLQVDPSRFAIRNIPLYGLITLAYGKRCQPQVQHVGGPAWVRTDGYDIEAAIPAGSPAYTPRQFRNGMAPGLELMLQAMLADRFKLVLGREMREMSVYNLVVATPGKLKPSADQNPPERLPTPGTSPQFKRMPGVVGPAIMLSSAPMSNFVEFAQRLADRPVIDRTELTGLFDFVLDWPALAGSSGLELETGMRDQLSSRMQERLGLALEPTRALVEVLVIERVERPSEN